VLRDVVIELALEQTQHFRDLVDQLSGIKL